MGTLKADFARKLAALRKGLRPKVSQAKLAEALGVESPQTVSRWERGETIPEFATIEKIAKFFDQPVGFFFDQGVELRPVEVGPTVAHLTRIIERQAEEIEALKRSSRTAQAPTHAANKEERFLLEKFRELPPKSVRRAFVFYALTLNEEFLIRVLEAARVSDRIREGLRTELRALVRYL